MITDLKPLTDKRLRAALDHAKRWTDHWASQPTSVFSAGQTAGYRQFHQQLVAELHRREELDAPQHVLLHDYYGTEV